MCRSDRGEGEFQTMARLILASRWIAIFILAVAIALIVVRWRFPQQRESGDGSVGFWRAVWQRLRQSRARSRQRELNAKALRGKTVLVIDPDERSSRVLVWRLESFGCSVVRARTGARGLELAKNAQPAVIIADALLPDMAATDLYAAAELPIVFVGTMKSQRREIAAIGRDVVCLGKPFDPDEAVSAAGELLRAQA